MPIPLLPIPFGMPRCFRFSVPLLLVFIVLQVLTLSTARGMTVTKANNVIAGHRISRTTGHHYQQATICFAAKSQKTIPAHHRHKARKQFSPVKIIPHKHTTVAVPVMSYAAAVYQVALNGYQFLYFRQINPPPPKA